MAGIAAAKLLRFGRGRGIIFRLRDNGAAGHRGRPLLTVSLEKLLQRLERAANILLWDSGQRRDLLERAPSLVLPACDEDARGDDGVLPAFELLRVERFLVELLRGGGDLLGEVHACAESVDCGVCVLSCPVLLAHCCFLLRST